MTLRVSGAGQVEETASGEQQAMATAWLATGRTERRSRRE